MASADSLIAFLVGSDWSDWSEGLLGRNRTGRTSRTCPKNQDLSELCWSGSPLLLFPSQIHAGLHHVDDIVAELFALLDDVEVGRSEVVGIFMIIDIVDVLVAETLAQVVDVVLNLERFVYVHLLAVVLEGVVHLR